MAQKGAGGGESKDAEPAGRMSGRSQKKFTEGGVPPDDPPHPHSLQTC